MIIRESSDFYDLGKPIDAGVLNHCSLRQFAYILITQIFYAISCRLNNVCITPVANGAEITKVANQPVLCFAPPF